MHIYSFTILYLVITLMRTPVSVVWPFSEGSTLLKFVLQVCSSPRLVSIYDYHTNLVLFFLQESLTFATITF